MSATRYWWESKLSPTSCVNFATKSGSYAPTNNCTTWSTQEYTHSPRGKWFNHSQIHCFPNWCILNSFIFASYCSDVTRATWPFNAPATRLLVQHLVHADNKENIKAPHYSLCMTGGGGGGYFTSQKASHAKSVSTPWRHLVHISQRYDRLVLCGRLLIAEMEIWVKLITKNINNYKKISNIMILKFVMVPIDSCYINRYLREWRWKPAGRKPINLTSMNIICSLAAKQNRHCETRYP